MHAGNNPWLVLGLIAYVIFGLLLLTFTTLELIYIFYFHLF